MKRIFPLVIVTLMLFSSCAPSDIAVTTGAPQTVHATTAGLPETTGEVTPPVTESASCPEYALAKYIIPYWQGDVVYNESILPIAGKDGKVEDISLLYSADKIFEVRSSSLLTLYKEGTDYMLIDGKIHIVEGGSIPVISYDSIYQKNPVKGFEGFICDNGRYMQYAEDATRHNEQLAVTYRHSDTWKGDIQLSGSSILKNTFKKLTSKSELNILLYGDSLGNGANSSGVMKLYAEPYAPTWYDMLTEALTAEYSSQIKLTNISRDGYTAKAAHDNYDSLKPDGKYDLAIIEFGMNDSSNAVSASSYASTVQKIMKKIADDNPDCEFILVAPILPNTEMPNFYHPGNPSDTNDVNFYGDKLAALQGDGVASVDITAFHSYMLEHKRYIDMSGNNINHPNDFVARLYAQALFCLLTSGKPVDLSDYVPEEPEPVSDKWELGGGWIDKRDGTFTYTNAGDKNGYLMYIPSDEECEYRKYKAEYTVRVDINSWEGDKSRGFGPVIVSAPGKELSIVNQTFGGAYTTGVGVNSDAPAKLDTKEVKQVANYKLTVTVDRTTGDVEYFLDDKLITSFTISGEELIVTAGIRNQYAGIISLIDFSLTEIK